MVRRSRHDVSAVAALDDPRRATLYEHVATRPDGVTRDEAAKVANINRHLAAYHLDRLADAGLLEVEYRRPPGRSGPGAGRPAKRYRRSARHVHVSLPSRDDELAARILAAALDPAGDSPAPAALRDAARDLGRARGAVARATCGDRPAHEDLIAALVTEFDAHGFAADHVGERLAAMNCPFHALAEAHRAMVCGMNLALMQGVAEGIGIAGLTATLDPQPGRCCVVLHTGSVTGSATISS